MGTLVTGVQTCALPIFAAALVHMLGPMPAALRRSITFDNGTEFNRHQRIANQLELDAYFCDPRAPWQKGGVENAIGRLRRNLPRKTNLDDLPPKAIDTIIKNYNNTPRKYLGFLPPSETFRPLHFKCESNTGSSQI